MDVITTLTYLATGKMQLCSSDDLGHVPAKLVTVTPVHISVSVCTHDIYRVSPLHCCVLCLHNFLICSLYDQNVLYIFLYISHSCVGNFLTAKEPRMTIYLSTL